MDRFVCIHGHFYQPPRENAWLEAIESQDSARPYHDWNQRITAECYAPNAHSKILDDEGEVARRINNYARISFNFGPTLLGWLEHHARDTYRAILDADEESRQRYAGHGSALAQAYNHMILPLASPRDKRTQVLWGLRDFERHFRRRPEGLWLAETAVDLESLEILAGEGILFTVLSPSQAGRVRPEQARIDTTMPYRALLPSGAAINLYFYNGPLSRAIAFEGLLSSGAHFFDRLVGAFDGDGDAERAQLLHIATDGETYGHHHAHGDMALAFALEALDADPLIRLTNYGEFLELHPPTHEVEIYENSSWSCAHGVARWRADCGCRVGRKKKSGQAWRAPLREALDWLRDMLAPGFETEARAWFDDPWAARDASIELILDRSDEALDAFFRDHARETPRGDARIRALKLLELQRQAQLMFTSCGWFFDDLSGIETLQILQYADRALQLAEELYGVSYEEGLLQRLERAPCRRYGCADGRQLFEKRVRPARLDLRGLAANFAASLQFDGRVGELLAPGYRLEHPEPERVREGDVTLTIGRVEIISRITREAAQLEFAFLDRGGDDVRACIRDDAGDSAHEQMVRELRETLRTAGADALVRALEDRFPGRPFLLDDLLPDTRHAVRPRRAND